MLKLADILLYWHTLKHLRFIQFYARIRFQLLGRLRLRSRISTNYPKVRAGVFLWATPIIAEISLLGPRTFRLLNIEHELTPSGGWNNPALEKLWLYNLHYFKDLTAKDACNRSDWHQALIVNWIENNAPPEGNGWEPYPTSLRIVNWIKWALDKSLLSNPQLPEEFNQSLVMQIRWLMKRLEWHLLGNHIFANAKALVFAGVYFEGEESECWFRQGLDIIARELDEQVLKDGGNFERSPMYHAIFLEDLLDIVNLAKVFPSLVDAKLVNYWCYVASKMLKWLKSMSHPDGRIALFNDAAFGIAPTFFELQAYAQSLEIDFVDSEYLNVEVSNCIEIKHWEETGYIRLSCKKAIAILDVAPIGPDYLPGHAHADTLSFELSVFDQRVIVNGGTSHYSLGPARLRERQTVSHSTVEINGLSSSEVWSGFRVARRAYPFDLKVTSDSFRGVVSCSHDGYKRLSGNPVHRRMWELREDSIKIQDEVQGSYFQAIARFIIHPDILVSETGPGTWQLRLPRGELITFVTRNGVGELKYAFYAPEFSRIIKTQCLAINLENGFSSVEMRWN